MKRLRMSGPFGGMYGTLGSKTRSRAKGDAWVERDRYANSYCWRVFVTTTSTSADCVAQVGQKWMAEAIMAAYEASR